MSWMSPDGASPEMIVMALSDGVADIVDENSNDERVRIYMRHEQSAVSAETRRQSVLSLPERDSAARN